MPEVLTKFFTPRHYDKEAKLQLKLRAILEKINGLLFCRFYDCGSFEVCIIINPGQMFPLPFFLQ